MHVFDVCFPGREHLLRSRRAFEHGGMLQDDPIRYSRYKDMVFLDALELHGSDVASPTRLTSHRIDPSMYRHFDNLSQAGVGLSKFTASTATEKAR